MSQKLFRPPRFLHNPPIYILIYYLWVFLSGLAHSPLPILSLPACMLPLQIGKKKKNCIQSSKVYSKNEDIPTGNQIPQKIFFNKYNIFLDVLWILIVRRSILCRVWWFLLGSELHLWFWPNRSCSSDCQPRQYIYNNIILVVTWGKLPSEGRYFRIFLFK